MSSGQGLPQLPSALEPFSIEGSAASGAFRLDDDVQPLLAGSAAAPPPAAAAAAAAAGTTSAHLQRQVSRFQLVSEAEDSWASYRHEAARCMELALPLTISQFFAYALTMISVAFVGRLGEEAMAVAVLAASFSNVTGFSVVLGFLGALDTLCGQAWGARRYAQLGVHLQRALLTTAATCAAVAALWAHVEPLMLAVGQQRVIAAGAARYLLLSIPALFLAGLFECFKRYLMAMGVVRPVTAASCAAVAVAPLFNWLLIFKAGLGLDGAVLATIATWAFMLCMLSAYLVWHERRRVGTPEQTWHGWTRECCKGLGAYYRLAVPSTLMVCLEWWAYEFTIFMAGWLPEPTLHVAAMGAMMQVSGFVFMLPSGLGGAAAVRVSNTLGACLPQAARRGAHTAAAMVLVTQACLAAALVLGRNQWARLFTDIPQVVATCAAAFPVMAGCMFGDGMNAVVGSILRGAGRQGLGALLNLCSYWGLGLPSSYVLAIHFGLGMKGLWVGLVICTSVQGVVMLVVLARFKWEREAAAAAERVHGGDDGLSAEDSAKLSPAGPAGKLDGSSGAGGSRDRGSSRDRGRWRDTTDLEDHP